MFSFIISFQIPNPFKLERPECILEKAENLQHLRYTTPFKIWKHGINYHQSTGGRYCHCLSRVSSCQYVAMKIAANYISKCSVLVLDGTVTIITKIIILSMEESFLDQGFPSTVLCGAKWIVNNYKQEADMGGFKIDCFNGHWVTRLFVTTNDLKVMGKHGWYLRRTHWATRLEKVRPTSVLIYFGSTPRMPVNTRIIKFLVGNPYKPSLSPGILGGG